MYCTNLRSSTVSTYKDCEFKYWLLYSIGLDSGQNFKALLGTLVHHSAELLAKAKRNSQITGKPARGKRIDYDFLLEISWNHYSKPYPDFDWSDKTKKFCQEQFKFIYESNLNPLKSQIISTEKQFAITVKKRGFKYDQTNPITGIREIGHMELRGTIDRIDNDDGNLYVVDYKTGKNTDFNTGKEKDTNSMMSDTQFRIYDIATSLIYPDFKARLFTIAFTQYEQTITVTFSPENMIDTIEDLRKIFKQIQNNEKPKRLIDDSSRSNEKWKCWYICNFSKMQIQYKATDGTIVDRLFKFDKKGLYPQAIELEGKIYKRVTKQPQSICQSYYNILLKDGVDKGSQKIYQLTVGKTSNGNLSRRNDYNNPKIFKGTLE